MQISSTLRTPLKQAAPRAATTPQNSLPQNEDKVQFSVDGSTVAKSAMAAAAYGAMVGGASAYLYGSTDIGSATAIHMTAILGGGALGARVLSHAIDHQFNKPSNYAMGALLGAGITSDGFHLVAPDPEGTGAARAMSRAIETAGLQKSDITHVNAHATATPIGDTAEALAINKAVGNHAAVYAPKSALGHSIGAVGALESVLTVLAVREGIIPPTLNLENQDPEIDLDVVKGEARAGQIDYAINNSFGFGGHNVALAFGRA